MYAELSASLDVLNMHILKHVCARTEISVHARFGMAKTRRNMGGVNVVDINL